MDLIRGQNPSLVLPIRESRVLVSQPCASAPPTVPLLLCKSKALSARSFSWALFQVCLGLLPMKCKQFTDLPWLGRTECFSWEECNLYSALRGCSAARYSTHARRVRARQETHPAFEGRAGCREYLLMSGITRLSARWMEAARLLPHKLPIPLFYS